MIRVSKKGIVFDFYNIFSLKAIKDNIREIKTNYIRHDNFNSIKILLKDLNITIKEKKEHKGYFMIYGVKNE